MQRHTRIVCALSAFLLVFGIGAGRLNAQATAAISGTITDTSGAAMADAHVQAKNIGTDITSTTNTDAQGRYRFPDLLIGNYDLTAVKAGFQTVTRRGITLTVGSQPVVDFQLPVGQQTQTVNVEGQGFAGGNAVDRSRRAGRRQTDSRSAAERPQLHSAAHAGSRSDPDSARRPRRGQHVLRQRPEVFHRGFASLRPGLLAGRPGHGELLEQRSGRGRPGTALGVEAIAEFQTLTNTYSTQFGGNGAVINASSRSGTNAFHGSAFEFLRNDKLESRNFFDGSESAQRSAATSSAAAWAAPSRRTRFSSSRTTKGCARRRS